MLIKAALDALALCEAKRQQTDRESEPGQQTLSEESVS
jgi:hypothetical protein